MARQNDAIQKAARNQRHTALMAFCGEILTAGVSVGWMMFFHLDEFPKNQSFCRCVCKKTWELMSFVIGKFQGSFNSCTHLAGSNNANV